MIHTLYDRQPLNLNTSVHPSVLDSIDAIPPVGHLSPDLDSAVSSAAQSALVAPEHLIIFSGNMSAEHKDYVTNSLLYSDLAAAHRTRKIANLSERRKVWYKDKTEIMKGLGWAGFADSMRAHSASSRKFTMDQVGLEILANALAAAAVPGISTTVLLNLASDAIKALRQGGEPLRLFQKESRTHQDGKFNIAVCMESPEGDVVLVSTNIYFITSHSVSNVLFWEWQSSDVDVASAGDKLVLNEGRFQRGKQRLADRLDDYMFNHILSLPLGD